MASKRAGRCQCKRSKKNGRMYCFKLLGNKKLVGCKKPKAKRKKR